MNDVLTENNLINSEFSSIAVSAIEIKFICKICNEHKSNDGFSIKQLTYRKLDDKTCLLCQSIQTDIIKQNELPNEHKYFNCKSCKEYLHVNQFSRQQLRFHKEGKKC